MSSLEQPTEVAGMSSLEQPPEAAPEPDPEPLPFEAAPPVPQPAATAPPTPPPPVATARVSAAASSPPPRSSAQRSRRPFVMRTLALLALLVVAVVVWLLVAHHGSNKPTATTVAAPVVVRVLIPEGFTRAQIAVRAHEDGLRGSYLAAAKRSPLLDPASYGAPHDTSNLEGFLFPATYDMYRGGPASRLVNEQLEAFKERFGSDFVHRAAALHVSPYQLLIIASIVEREAQIPGDRAKVAAVIYNRLHANTPLAVDASIRYALGDYTQPLTAAQLQLNSPYNTRLHRGLPPTPISNPGMSAIEAAAHPAHVSYLYYVAGADGCGEEVFSTNIAEFERDAAAYREALRQNGGRVPTCKKKR
jgi:cell division protein YceG involved in septum cleavage